MNFLKRPERSRLGCAIMFLMCILSGCGNRHGEETAPTAYRVVWKMEVTYQNGDWEGQRSYEDPEQMQMIMNYLRWIKPKGTPTEDPMTQQGEEIDVQLYYSDGTTKTYHQRCSRYFREGEGPWENVDPEQAGELSRLLGILDGKPRPSAPGPAPPLLRPRLSCAKKEAVLLS